MIITINYKIWQKEVGGGRQETLGLQRFKGGKVRFKLASSWHSLVLETKTGWVIHLTRPTIVRKKNKKGHPGVLDERV